MRFLRKYLKILIVLFLLVLAGLLLPQHVIIPVEGAGSNDWNPDTFWYYPWGESVTHKGVDIFAEKGREVLAATNGIVVYEGPWGIGGNTVMVLGGKNGGTDHPAPDSWY